MSPRRASLEDFRVSEDFGTKNFGGISDPDFRRIFGTKNCISTDFSFLKLPRLGNFVSFFWKCVPKITKKWKIFFRKFSQFSHLSAPCCCDTQRVRAVPGPSAAQHHHSNVLARHFCTPTPIGTEGPAKSGTEQFSRNFWSLGALKICRNFVKSINIGCPRGYIQDPFVQILKIRPK